MKNVLFKKYLAVMLLILSFSFLILGTMLWIFVSKYWKNDKQDLLFRNSLGISKLISHNVQEIEDSIYIVNDTLIKSFLDNFSDNTNSDIFVTNASGNIIIHSGSFLKYDNLKMSENVMNDLRNGEYINYNFSGEIYKKDHFLVGVPVVLNENNQSKVLGAVFTAMSLEYLNDFRFDILKMFMIAMIITFFISCIAIGFLCHSMANPLKQMVKVVKEFGQGDFSNRAFVQSNDEIGELANEVNSMANFLSKSEEIKQNFISNVSHELKTPMTTISGFIDGILDGTIEKNNSEVYLKVVSSEIKRLSRIVKSMLSLSRIDNGDFYLNRTSFDILGIIIDIFVFFEKVIKEKEVEIIGLNSLKSVFIEGDSDLIYQVVYNILENAVKFVNKNGYIKININQKNGNAIISIKNTGLGIPLNEIELIFERFYKTDKSRSRDKVGLGIGLYIVRKILRIHGGDIYARGQENECCEFIFYLPLTKK